MLLVYEDMFHEMVMVSPPRPPLINIKFLFE